MDNRSVSGKWHWISVWWGVKRGDQMSSVSPGTRRQNEGKVLPMRKKTTQNCAKKETLQKKTPPLI